LATHHRDQTKVEAGASSDVSVMTDHAGGEESFHASAIEHAKPHLPGELGIWFFVAGDLMVFTLFFILIAVGSKEQASIFAQSRAKLDMWVGVTNTALLLTGSWFVATGVEQCRRFHNPKISRYFSLAILCGLLFVVNKSFEWGSKIHAGITPATNDFYMYFFVFTGIHLLHVLIGIGVLLFLRSVSRRPTLGHSDIRTLESGASFWHLVDLLWVFLFALLYLV
jgi:nitric oxide reductase NorE protein